MLNKIERKRKIKQVNNRLTLINKIKLKNMAEEFGGIKNGGRIWRN
jgi:hypothetical protein